jgi:hypothetical protein
MPWAVTTISWRAFTSEAICTSMVVRLPTATSWLTRPIKLNTSVALSGTPML